jgi:DNA modification methylase
MTKPKPLNITYKSPFELKPYQNNARTHSKAQIEQLKASIQEYGFTNPILTDDSGTIIAGHGRAIAAQELGIKQVPCVILADLTPAQKRAYILADNKLAENAGWDRELLAIELGELKEAGFDLQLTGFSNDEIDNLILDSQIVEDCFDIDSALDEIKDKPVTQPNDTWQMGKHFLLCGDSCNPDHVSKLMDGAEVDLYLTDPPYNVDYKGTAGKILNDKQEDSAFNNFLTDAFSCAHNVMKTGASAYVFHADSEGYNFRSAIRNAGFTLRQCLIWVKNSLVMGRQDYHWRHEPILYFWKDGSKHYFTADRSQSTVIDDKINIAKLTKEEMKSLLKEILDNQHQQTTVIYEDKPLSNADHPTMKPIKLLARLICNSSKPDDIVLDTFAGSGSTLIACEQLNRVNYSMELDPKFCDVIVKRYIQFHNSDADVRLFRDGKNIDFNFPVTE